MLSRFFKTSVESSIENFRAGMWIGMTECMFEVDVSITSSSLVQAERLARRHFSDRQRSSELIHGNK